jgi:hypothetical protein
MTSWLATTVVQSHSTIYAKEIGMKMLYSVIIAGMLGVMSTIALAGDPAAAPSKPAAKPQGGTITTATAPAPVKLSQQDKMRLCSKQATGKNGCGTQGLHEGLPVEHGVAIHS